MQTNRFLGSVLLIAGISIGAGMLALPASTAAYGFLPSLGLLLLCWVCMTLSGFLMLEVNLWFKPGTNLVSMAEQTLGGPGKILAWLAYVLLFYSLMAAYVSGMGDLIYKTISDLFSWQIYNKSGSIVLILLVAIAVYLGARSVDHLNRVFFFAKVVAYIAVIVLVTQHIEFPKLTFANTQKIWLALPIVAVCFGFQNIIPSLRIYLNDDVKKLRSAILLGSLITLTIYILWEFIILGVIPIEGDQGLLKILASGQPASGIAEALNHVLENSWITWLFRAFTVFAIVTSFIGVSFSLFDFVIDSFKIKRTQLGKISALAITFLPPLVYAFLYPDGFILALSYGGVFVAILLGIFPVMMAWSGRYVKKIATGYRPEIGRGKMVFVVVFCLVVIFGQLVIA